VAISAGTTYVASYFAPLGRYASDLDYFTTGVDNAPLHALASSGAGGNGVYAYAGTSSFPASTYQSSNYWVDVVFALSVPPTSTPTPTPTSGPQTITFETAPGQDRPLNDQYPSRVIDWGTGSWYLSAPYGVFTGKSISFNGPSMTRATFAFVTPRRLNQVKAYNGGTTTSVITLSCLGQAPATASVGVGLVQTINTGWTGVCTGVTVDSTNGWDTNFDNFVIQ